MARRPNLGIVDVESSSDNNVLQEAERGWNLCPFVDGHPDPAYPQRYKGISRTAGRATLRDFT